MGGTAVTKVFCALFIVACSVLATTTCADAEDLHQTFARLETRWKAAMDQLHVPGLSIAVVYNDKVVYTNGLGVRRVDPALPFTADTTCYIASSTKPFVALAVMTLVDAGKISLDAPVKTYLPRLAFPDHALADTVTVRDLLCHRFGIGNSVVTLAEAYTGQWDDDFVYRELAESTGAKGKWEYDNLHFTIAGRIIEAVTGQPWQEYVRDAILRPLGMTHTTARATEMYAYDDVALGLLVEDDKWIVSPMLKIDKTMHAAGGMGGSARDFAQWLRLQMSDGSVDGKRILSESSLNEMFKPLVEPKTRFFRFGREKMGLAWYRGSYNGELLVHHFGGYIGYHAHISFMPEHKLGVVVLANSDREGSMLIHQIAADVYDTLLHLPGEDYMPTFIERTQKVEAREIADRAKRPPLSDGPLTLSKPLDAYVGTFTSDRFGTLILKQSGDTLVGSLGNLALTFHADKPEQLIMIYAIGQETVTFDYASNGAVTQVNIASYGPYTMRFTRVAP